MNLLKCKELILLIVAIAVLSIVGGFQQIDGVIKSKSSNRHLRQIRELFHCIGRSTFRSHIPKIKDDLTSDSSVFLKSSFRLLQCREGPVNGEWPRWCPYTV